MKNQLIRRIPCMLLVLMLCCPALASASTIIVERGKPVHLCVPIVDSAGAFSSGESPNVTIEKITPAGTIYYYNWTSPAWDATWNATDHLKALVEDSDAELYCVNWDQPSTDPRNYQYTAIYRNTGGTVNGIDTDQVFIESTASTMCQITGATSGTSFTIGNCTDHDGGAITLATDSFVGTYLVAYNRSTTQCNVVGEGVFVSDLTAGVVTVRESDMPGSGFSATPNTSNCDVEVRP